MQTDSEAAKSFIGESLKDVKSKSKQPSLLSHHRQIAASMLANCGMINCGLVYGFGSAVLPPLLSSGPGLHATVDQASWVVGVAYISASVACAFAGILIDSVGRRWGLQIVNIPFISGWLLMAMFPLSLMSLYIGRLLLGLGNGLATCVAITYTTEITSSTTRTTLVTLNPIMTSIGILLAYVFALMYQTSWTEYSYFATGLTVFSLVLLPLLPESPLWLLEKGRKNEALEALRKLRGAFSSREVADELESLVDRTKEKKKTGSWQDTIHSFSRPEVYKPLIIMNVYFLFHQLCGVPIVIQYGVRFIQAAGVHAEAYYVALGIAVVRMISTFLTSWACSKYGRRRPAIVSGVFMGASLLGLAISSLMGVASWVSGTLVLLYILTSSVGFSSLPWSMLGEVFPTDVRGVSSGMTMVILNIGILVNVTTYPKLMLVVGPFGMFMFYGLSGLVGTLFIYLYLPETHGKTLLEIENHFKGNKRIEAE